jgi:hypothetical protein
LIGRAKKRRALRSAACGTKTRSSIVSIFQSGGATGDHADHGFLVTAGRRRLSHRRGALFDEKKGVGVMPRKDFEMLHLLRDFLQWPAARRDDATEPNVPPEENMQYFGEDGDRIQMMLNFPVISGFFTRLRPAISNRWCAPWRRLMSARRQRNG